MAGLLGFEVQLRIGPGNTWVDVTGSVELGDAALEETFGASGQFADVAASTVSFQLDNVDGAFTPDNPASPHYGRLTEGAAMRWIASSYINSAGLIRSRWMTGEITSLLPAFPGDVAAWSRVIVSGVDLLARLERHELRDVLTEQTLYDNAQALWLLDDPLGSEVAAESSRYTVDPLTPAGNVAQIGWSGGNGLAFDGLPTLALNGDIEAPRGWLTGTLPGGYTMVELWFTITADALHTGVSETPILFASTTGTGETRTIYLTDAGRLRQNGSLAESKVVTDGQVHHVLYLYDPTFNVLGLELDGSSFSSPPLGSAQPAVTGATIHVGGYGDVNLSGFANPVAWPGTISRVAVGNNADRAAWRQHYALGTTMQETTRQRIARLLSFLGGNPVSALADSPAYPMSGGYRWLTALSSGAVDKFSDVIVGPQETQGKSVLAALQEVMRLEGGRMWTHQLDDRATGVTRVDPTSDSVIVFGGRGTYRPAAVALTLDVEGDLDGQPKLERNARGQVAIVTASARTRAVTVTDTAIRSRIGNVSAQVAVPAAAQLELLFMAQDRIAQTAQVRLRLVGLSIDPATGPTAARDAPFAHVQFGTRWAPLLALSHGDRLRLVGLPVKQLGFGQIDGYFVGATVMHSIGGSRYQLRFSAADMPAESLIGDDLYGRAAADGDLKLNAGITASATSMQVKFTSVGLSVDSGDYPLDLDVAGERVTVAAAPAGATSPQTVSIARAVGVTAARAHVTDDLVDVAIPGTAAW